MNQNSGNPTVFMLVLPAFIAPFVALASIAWLINDQTGLHPVICIGIWAGLTWATASFVSRTWIAAFGVVITTIAIFGMLAAMRVDLLWSAFWAGVYLVATYFAIKSVWVGDDDVEGDKPYGFWDGFRDNLFNADSAAVSSAPAKPRDSRTYHQKVGTCRGTNTITGNASGHQLLKCGRCSTAGCTDLNCTNRNFNGTKCLTCDLSANAK